MRFLDVGRATLATMLLSILPVFTCAADSPAKPMAEIADAGKPVHFQPQSQRSQGSVTTGGERVDYEAVAGTLVVHAKGWDDVPQNAPKDAAENPPPESSMFYVAYFRTPATGKGPQAPRPITFFYNGGPGSPSIWLHMGAFGPKRVVTADDSHTPPAPYTVINNDSSLLDATDMVFIDAPGTGFSRIAGKDADKAFWGVDQDAHAFAEFIEQFLSKYGRWNSPKYLFGESYGTTRSAALANVLTADYNIDLNGVILLSQILMFDDSADEPQFNPGVDLPYVLVLPTYAATAWYHHKLPGTAPADLGSFLPEVERFALGEYAQALLAGSTLPAAQRQSVAERLHQYTGVPVTSFLKADLRINDGTFQQMLQADDDIATGRLDARFSGATLDPLSKEIAYDPQSAAISSTYYAAFNDYVRRDLHWGEGQFFRAADLWKTWDYLHQAPGANRPMPQAANVMPDLATAMKLNPYMQVLVHAGYYDMATPYFAAEYEMRHLPVPADLQKNIEFAFYPSGHMMYAHEPSLRELHAKTAAFIARSSKHVTR
jgi:carboxypeptidase C (cathepsin A)